MKHWLTDHRFLTVVQHFLQTHKPPKAVRPLPGGCSWSSASLDSCPCSKCLWCSSRSSSALQTEVWTERVMQTDTPSLDVEMDQHTAQSARSLAPDYLVCSVACSDTPLHTFPSLCHLWHVFGIPLQSWMPSFINTKRHQNLHIFACISSCIYF